MIIAGGEEERFDLNRINTLNLSLEARENEVSDLKHKKDLIYYC